MAVKSWKIRRCCFPNSDVAMDLVLRGVTYYYTGLSFREKSIPLTAP